jgi:hypothetical protein
MCAARNGKGCHRIVLIERVFKWNYPTKRCWNLFSVSGRGSNSARKAGREVRRKPSRYQHIPPPSGSRFGGPANAELVLPARKMPGGIGSFNKNLRIPTTIAAGRFLLCPHCPIYDQLKPPTVSAKPGSSRHCVGQAHDLSDSMRIGMPSADPFARV